MTLSADTTVFGDATALADGQTVSVRGTFSTTDGTLAATSIEVGGASASTPPPPNVRGEVASVGTETFDLTASGCDRFLPTSATIHVVYTSATAFQGDKGATLDEAGFAALLAVGARVKAEGTYDAATSTLSATRIKLDVGHDAHR